MSADYTRFPFIVLPYNMKNIALPKELMIDYNEYIMYVKDIDSEDIIPLNSNVVDNHTNRLDNPHKVTKKQLDLNKVENYKVCSTDEMLAGVHDKYVTPAMIKSYLEYLLVDKFFDDKYILTINTIPVGADVKVFYNDDWHNGNIHGLYNGTYNYIVSKPGYYPEDGAIIINNANENYTAVLERIKYTLIIHTSPSDAIVRVYYDNTWNYGKQHTLYSGTYNYNVSLDGYNTVSDSVTVEYSDKEINVPLSIKKYILTMNTIPANATVEVYYNNMWVIGKVHNLPTGIYSYKAYLLGYTTEEGTVEVDNTNTEKNIVLELNKYKLTINVIPNDATIEVYYNSTWNTGKTHNLINGTYNYRILKTGYKTITDKVIIYDGDVILDKELESN